jgi:hypothetical protein
VLDANEFQAAPFPDGAVALMAGCGPDAVTVGSRSHRDEAEMLLRCYVAGGRISRMARDLGERRGDGYAEYSLQAHRGAILTVGSAM